MADITITAANVLRVSGKTELVTAGVTVTAGKVGYLDTTDNQYNLAINTGATAAAAKGIALNNASAGQPLIIQTTGDITIGGTVVVGTLYTVSSTAGGIEPVGSLESLDEVTPLGVGISTTVITLAIKPSAVAVP